MGGIGKEARMVGCGNGLDGDGAKRQEQRIMPGFYGLVEVSTDCEMTRNVISWVQCSENDRECYWENSQGERETGH